MIQHEPTLTPRLRLEPIEERHADELLAIHSDEEVAYWADAKVVGRVPPTVFIPQPKVESALVSIRRRPAPAVGAPYERLFTLSGDPRQLVGHFSGALITISRILRKRSQHGRFQGK